MSRICNLTFVFTAFCLLQAVSSDALTPDTLPMDIDPAADIFPDPYGFVVVVDKADEVPIRPIYEPDVFYRQIKTYINTLLIDENRANKVKVGSATHITHRSEYYAYNFEDLYFWTDEKMSIITYNIHSTSSTFSGSNSTRSLSLDGYSIEQQSGIFTGHMGGAGGSSSSLTAYPIRFTIGNQGWVVFNEYRNNGDIFQYELPYTDYSLGLLGNITEEGERDQNWVRLDGDEDHDDHNIYDYIGLAAAGSSLSSDTQAILIGEMTSYDLMYNQETNNLIWRFTDSGITTETLHISELTFPSISVTENIDGEMLIISQEDDDLKVFSSLYGNTIFPSISFPQGSASWFDSSGAYHLYSGSLTTDEECPQHLYRSPSGDWIYTDLCSLGSTDTLISTSFDITRMADLRVGLHKRGVSTDTIVMLSFNSGVWASEVLDESDIDTVFAKLRIGGIKNDDFLVIYQENDSSTTKATAALSQWMAALENGTIDLSKVENWTEY